MPRTQRRKKPRQILAGLCKDPRSGQAKEQTVLPYMEGLQMSENASWSEAKKHGFFCLFHCELNDSGVERAHHDKGPLLGDQILQLIVSHGQGSAKRKERDPILRSTFEIVKLADYMYTTWWFSCWFPFQATNTREPSKIDTGPQMCRFLQ